MRWVCVRSIMVHVHPDHAQHIAIKVGLPVAKDALEDNPEDEFSCNII